MVWGRRAGCSALVLLGAATVCSADSGSTRGHWLLDPQTHCYVFYTDPHPADSVTWSGECANRVASGQGTATFTDRGRFAEAVSGNFQGGAAEGAVRVNWADGSHFDGFESAGRFNGKGTLTTAKGDRFDGQWVNDRMAGQGVILWANGDRYEGALKDSKADGRGMQVWADGHKYEGEWKNDLPNGRGVLTRRDGSKFEGNFAEGQPVQPAIPAAGTDAPVARVTAQVPEGSAPAAGARPQPAQTDGDSSNPERGSAPAWLDRISGQKLIAVDGSSIAISSTEGGLTREIVPVGGAPKRLVFTYLNGKQGTVADASDADKVLGLFRLADNGIDAEYADGRSERLMLNPAGGLSLASKGYSGAASCIAWYPPGHAFSMAERQTALAEYASRIGLSIPSHKQAAKSACTVASAETTPDVQAAATPPAQQNAAPDPAKPRASKGKRDGSSKAAAMKTANSFEPILVRTSQVHLVDVGNAPLSASAAISDSQGSESMPPPGSASKCLSVETDGATWGFRNHCGYPVQFAYCVMNGSNQLNSCEGGAVTGGVMPNGFGVLFAESNLKNADHDFRWIACNGNASDVVPRLVRADPPAGRCVRAQAS